MLKSNSNSSRELLDLCSLVSIRLLSLDKKRDQTKWIAQHMPPTGVFTRHHQPPNRCRSNVCHHWLRWPSIRATLPRCLALTRATYIVQSLWEDTVKIHVCAPACEINAGSTSKTPNIYRRRIYRYTKKLTDEFCLFLQTWPMCLGNSSHIFFGTISCHLPRWLPKKACGHDNLWTVGSIAFKFGMFVL